MSAPFDLGQTDHLLTTTRSVRKRLDLTRPVEREVVLDCLRVALQAPSGGNTQPWRWLVIDDAETKARLGALYSKQAGPYLAAGKADAERAGTGVMDRIIDSAVYLAEHIGEVPVMVIPCLLMRVPEGAGVMDTSGFYGSILPAAWSFMLALRSRGLGSAWTTLHLAHEAEAAELLGIPDTVTQTLLIPVAYYTGTDFKPAPRKPIEDVTYFNRWKQRG